MSDADRKLTEVVVRQFKDPSFRRHLKGIIAAVEIWEKENIQPSPPQSHAPVESAPLAKSHLGKRGGTSQWAQPI